METKIPLIAENGQSLIDLTKNKLSMSVYINLVKNIFPLSRINFFKKIIDYQMGISSSKYKGLLDEYN